MSCYKGNHADVIAPELKVKPWKTIFFKSQAENIIYAKIMKRNPTVSLKTYAENRGVVFFSMFLWLKQTTSQSNPNFPNLCKVCASSSRWPMKLYDGLCSDLGEQGDLNLIHQLQNQTPKTQKLEFIRIRWSSGGGVNQKQGLWFGRVLSLRVITVTQHTVGSTWIFWSITSF